MTDDPTTTDASTTETSTGDEPTTDGTEDGDPATEDADWPTSGGIAPELAERLSTPTVPLGTADPAEHLTDLDPLRDHLTDVRVVALGEATHGTREFFRLKHRLIRFLVEQLDYRLVALEANFAETLAIDDYVVHGRGDAKGALEGTRFWTWNTEEVLALIEWLREFNADRPLDDRVRFYGIDAQFTAGPAEALADFLADRDPDCLECQCETLGMLAEDGVADYRNGGDDGNDEDDSNDAREGYFADADALVDALDDWFDERSTEDSGADGDEFALHRRHLRTLGQAVEYHQLQYEDDDEAALKHRDRAMADNLTWILDRESRDRIAVWAHDEHVQRGSRNSHLGTGPAMGSHLAERYGDDYYAVGFDFAGGEFQAIGPADDGGRELRTCSLGPPPEDAATRLFAAVDDPRWFVDFDAVTTADDRLAEWFEAERTVRSVGAIYDPDEEHDRNHDSYRLPSAFDGLVFVQETSQARPLDDE